MHRVGLQYASATPAIVPALGYVLGLIVGYHPFDLGSRVGRCPSGPLSDLLSAAWAERRRASNILGGSIQARNRIAFPQPTLQRHCEMGRFTLMVGGLDGCGKGSILPT
jgi:hypothetical protein